MRTYIINLERSKDRKKYVNEILKNVSFLSPEYVTAVDGREMTTNQRNENFDDVGFLRRYSVKARPGEVGCTLSHQKCYKKIVNDNEPYALILEDDFWFLDTQKLEYGIEQLEQLFANTTGPLIVLLSGWYWYKDVKKMSSGIKLASVYDAFLTHSYVINQAAAKLLIEERPYITADDWIFIRKKGVNLKAVLPHLIDQNWDGVLYTTVNEVPIKGKSISWFVRNLFRLLYLKYLLFTGRFEKA